MSSEEDVVARVKELTGGKGAYGTLECVGGDATGKLVQASGSSAAAAAALALCARMHPKPPLLPPPPQNLKQATRDNGTVLIFGAMGSFDFTCPIPDILFRCVRPALPPARSSLQHAPCIAGPPAAALHPTAGT